MQSLELIYTQKFQKAGMSIFGDAKSYAKCQKLQCKFSDEYFENEFLDFPSLKNNYLQPLIFR